MSTTQDVGNTVSIGKCPTMVGTAADDSIFESEGGNDVDNDGDGEIIAIRPTISTAFHIMCQESYL